MQIVVNTNYDMIIPSFEHEYKMATNQLYNLIKNMDFR
jgi:hypothetical protein